MDRRQLRWPLRLAALVVGGIAFALWTSQNQTPNVITLSNQSGQKITTLTIFIAGKPNFFEGVSSGVEVTAPANAGDAFSIDGRLADETRIRGMGTTVERLKVIVLPGGQVDFKQSK